MILKSKKIKCVIVSTFPPIYLPWSDGTGCHDVSFLNAEYQPSFFTLFFHWRVSEWVSEWSCSVVSDSATPWTVAYQAPPSMGFSGQRALEWVAISFSRGSSWPRDRTRVSRIPGRCFNLWATREAHWRESQTIPVFLLQEPNEQCEKVKR